MNYIVRNNNTKVTSLFIILNFVRITYHIWCAMCSQSAILKCVLWELCCFSDRNELMHCLVKPYQSLLISRGSWIHIILC